MALPDGRVVGINHQQREEIIAPEHARQGGSVSFSCDSWFLLDVGMTLFQADTKVTDIHLNDH
jgi:hypothetical protein